MSAPESGANPIRTALLTASHLAISLIAMWTGISLLAHADDPLEHWQAATHYTAMDRSGAPAQVGEADLVQDCAFVRDYGQAASGRRQVGEKLIAATIGYSVQCEQLIVEAHDSAIVPQPAEHPPYRATPPPPAPSARA